MQRLKALFESLDSYGRSFSMNYKGKDSVKTTVGSCCGCLHLSFFLTLFIIGSNEVLSYTDPQITQVS